MSNNHRPWVIGVFVAMAISIFTMRSFAAGSVTLAWDPSPNAAGYIVFAGTAPNSYATSTNVGKVTTWTVSGLASGQAYYFAVKAIDSQGVTSSYSNEIATTGSVAAVPASITTPAPGTTLPSSSVTFQWSAGTGVTSYQLVVSASTFSTAKVVTGSSTSATVSGLPTDGSSVPVRLGSLINGAWQYRDYSYIAAKVTSTPTPPRTTPPTPTPSPTPTPTPTPSPSPSPAPSGTFTIFKPSWTPSRMEDDAQAVELGVKFKADYNGFVTGVRFYKYSKNTGTHTGSLWTTSGQLLGRVTFSGESGSGWQQAMFASPIAITANTTYVVSYHTTVGFYGVTEPGLAAGQNSPPLHALAGNNGVYNYRSTPGFPQQTYNSSNYWVDVVYRTP